MIHLKKVTENLLLEEEIELLDYFNEINDDKVYSKIHKLQIATNESINIHLKSLLSKREEGIKYIVIH